MLINFNFHKYNKIFFKKIIFKTLMKYNIRNFFRYKNQKIMLKYLLTSTYDIIFVSKIVLRKNKGTIIVLGIIYFFISGLFFLMKFKKNTYFYILIIQKRIGQRR